MKRHSFAIALTSVLALLMFGCTESSRSSGGDDNQNNNDGVTPGGMWGRGSDSGGGGVDFGSGQAAGGNNANSGTPGEVAAADCTAACNRIGECFAEEIDASDLQQCPAACQQEAVQAEVDCIANSSCEDILTACVSVGGTASSAECSSACSKVQECFGEYIDPGDMAECVPGCTAEATAAEIQCVVDSSCDAMLTQCFGIDEEFNSTTGPSNNVSQGDCVNACDRIAACYSDGPPTQADLDECVMGCMAEGTAAEIACALEGSCFDMEMCLDGGANNSGNNFNNGNVSFECMNACSYLVWECEAFGTEDQCYSQCASWPSDVDVCLLEASCADWRNCL